MTNEIKQRLDYLRKAIGKANISYGEIAELVSLAEHIDESDNELRQWAGIPEDMEKCPTCGKFVKNEKICQTHDDNDDPNNKVYCEYCPSDKIPPHETEPTEEIKKDKLLKRSMHLLAVLQNELEAQEEQGSYDYSGSQNIAEVNDFFKEAEDELSEKFIKECNL